MKAILILDMPNNCYNCQYCRFDARKYNFRGCVLTDTDVQDGTIDICKEVHSCCPLKPMPKELVYEGYDSPNKQICEAVLQSEWGKKAKKTDAICIRAFSIGYNACLEEIEK